MRVLIVDDEYSRRSELKSLLSSCGDCDAAASGEIAFMMFVAAHKESAPYSLITMDFYLGDARGPEVLHKIRAWEDSNKAYAKNKEAKIIMVTSTQVPKDIMASFREGCESFIEKPATADKIKASLVELGILK